MKVARNEVKNAMVNPKDDSGFSISKISLFTITFLFF